MGKRLPYNAPRFQRRSSFRLAHTATVVKTDQMHTRLLAHDPWAVCRWATEGRRREKGMPRIAIPAVATLSLLMIRVGCSDGRRRMTRRARSWFSPARRLVVAFAVTILSVVTVAMPAQAVSSNDPLTVATPGNGDIYALDQVVYPHVEVADASAVLMIAYVVDGRIICTREFDPFDCDPPVPIDTSTIGSHSLEFRVYDTQLNVISLTHYYLVGDPNQPDSTDPTVQIAAPADGGSYTLGQLVDASYSC